jgi:hypothetical protein
MTESNLALKNDLDTAIAEAGAALATLAETKDAELAKKILALAQLTSPEIKGVEGHTRTSIPEVRVRQPSSSSASIPADCKVGQLYDSDGAILGPSLRFIPILRHALRKKWNDENRIDCMSMDGENGSRYGKCKECPYGQFEQGQAIQCSPGHSFFVVSEDLSALYRLDFLKSSAKAGRNILKLTKPPALWSKSFSLSASQETGKGRNYCVLHTQATGTKTPDNVMEVCEALHKFFHANYLRALELQSKYAETSDGKVEGSSDVQVAEGENDTINFADSL